GHVHRRLVRLERHQRIFRLDGIARLHQHFDDGNILEVADVGDADLDRAHTAAATAVFIGSLPSSLQRTYTVTGFGASGLISYLRIASATCFGEIDSLVSASAFSAATAT